MAHIGLNVRRRRMRLGWTLLKLATLSGLDPSFLSRLERCKTGYSTDTEEALAKAFSIKPSVLHNDGSNVIQAPEDHRRIPILDYVKAGHFSFVDDTFGPEELQEATMTILDHSAKTFAMWIKGDSMTPEFKPGDLVVIDPAVDPSPGDYVVAANEAGEATFKRYRLVGQREGKTVFELVPSNPDYPAWRSDEEPLRIIGTMMEHRKPRRR